MQIFQKSRKKKEKRSPVYEVSEMDIIDPSEKMAELIYSVRNVNMSYESKTNDRTQVLKEVYLDIPANEFICIQGGNGCGKTTFMHILAAVHGPSLGEVLIDLDGALTPIDYNDRKLKTHIRQKESIQILQNKNLVSFMNVYSNIVMPMNLRGHEIDDYTHDRIHSLASELGIHRYLKHMPGSLSGGQQQLAAVIRSLVNGHRIILADEPTASLDKFNKQKVMKKLKEHSEEAGKGVIIITHDLDIARDYCDRFVKFVPHKYGGYTVLSEVIN